jgi:hypothetical protein
VDVLLNRPAFAADSKSLILRCEASGAEMLVAWHGLATAYYLLKRRRTEQQAMVEVDKILPLTSVVGFAVFRLPVTLLTRSHACEKTMLYTYQRFHIR